jgi:phage terminase large subunit
MERQIEWHFSPLPRQAEALQYLSNDSSVNYVLYGGAAGGGKTMLGCTWQILRRLKYPGTRGLIGRAKLDTLKKTTVATFLEVANRIGLVAGKEFTYNQQSHIIKFMNGSEIILADLFLYPSDPYMTDLGGLEITDFLIDEAAEVSEKAFNIVSSRVRYKLNEFNLVPKGLITCNPSKNWIYNQFYLPYKNDSLPEYKAFVQALPGDNLYLPTSYVQSLTRLPEVDRKRLLEGDWEYDNSADRLYQYEELMRCFRESTENNGQMYLTGDIARLGKDRTILCVWNGMTCIDIVVLSQKRIDETKREVQRLMSQYNIKLSNVLVDEDGVGGGLCDALRCRGFQNGSKAVRGSQYQNLKADCYFKLGELIDKNQIILPIRYQEDIVKELELIRRVNPDADGKLKVTSKETISQRTGGLSPDFADAIMMRAYFDLVPNYNKYAFI